MKKIIYLIIMISFSCKKNKLDSEYIVNNNIKSDVLLLKAKKNIYTLKLTDSIFANSKGLPISSYVHKLINDSLFYYIYKSNKMALLNTNKALISKIELPNKVNGNIKSFDFINDSTLVVAQDFPTKIFLININENKIVKESKLNKILFKTENSFFNNRTNTEGFNDVNFNVDFNNLYYNKIDSSIYLGIEPFDSHLLKGFKNTSTIGVFDIYNNNWKEFFGKQEGMYRYKGDYTFGNNYLSYKNLIFVGDTIFVNYKVNHKIYYYIHNKFGGEFKAMCKYSKKINLPMKPIYSTDVEKNKEMYLSTPYYSDFFYHTKVKLYSRLYLDRQLALNENELYNDIFEKDAILIFFDKNFNYVGEYLFPYHMYNKLVPTSDGFFMFSNQHTNFDDNKKYFSLKYVYKIKKIN